MPPFGNCLFWQHTGFMYIVYSRCSRFLRFKRWRPAFGTAIAKRLPLSGRPAAVPDRGVRESGFSGHPGIFLEL